MKKLHGVITAMLTPTNLSGKIDLEEAVRIAKHSVEGGVDGLFITGTNGEGIKYTNNQRLAMSKEIINSIDRSKTMICIHTGAPRIEETIELTIGAYNIGADSAAIISPSYITYSEDELYDYYTEILKKIPVDFPVYLYNIPQRTGNDISVSLCENLYAKFPNLVGIKYSYCDLMRTAQYLNIDGFSVLHGSDIFQLQFLTMGCDGIISGLSGVYPVPFAKVRQKWQTGDIDGAQKWQKICYEVYKVLNEGNITVMKQAMKIKGFSFHCSDYYKHENQKLEFMAELKRIDNLIEDALKKDIISTDHEYGFLSNAI